MTLEEKIDKLLLGQVKLFWLITNVPGVSRSASNVQFFESTLIQLEAGDQDQSIRLINGYRKAEGLAPISLEELK